MKSIRILFITLMMLCYSSLSMAHDANLALFNVDLKNASKQTLIEAIKQKGCNQTKNSINLVSFNVSNLGFSDFTHLDLVFNASGKFVTASYNESDSLYGDNLNRLVNMLEAKYGAPNSNQLSDPFQHEMVWKMPNNMEIVFNNDSFSGTTLKYIDTAALAKFEAEVKNVQQQSAIKESKKKAGVF